MDTRECALRVARAPPPERRSADRSPTAPRRHLTSEAQQSSGTRRAIAVAVRTPVSVTAAYQPRKAGEDLLFRALQRHLETFLARAEAVDRPVPSFVERELRAYLACGIPAHGFTWLQCESCKKNLVVPSSCKGRGFCPSCPRSAMGPLLSHAAALLARSAPQATRGDSRPVRPRRPQLVPQAGACSGAQQSAVRRPRGDGRSSRPQGPQAAAGEHARAQATTALCRGRLLQPARGCSGSSTGPHRA